METFARVGAALMRRLLMLASFAACRAGADPSPAELHVQISGIIPGQGELAYLLFDKKAGFPRDRTKALAGDYVPAPNSDIWEWKLSVNAQTKYVVTVYQDLNKNRKLDKSLLGIPKEPVGASNNPKVFFGPPDYADCEFVTKDSTNKIEIQLRR